MTKYLLLCITIIVVSCNIQPDNKSDEVSVQSNSGFFQENSFFSINIATRNDFIIAKNTYENVLLYDTNIYSKLNDTIKLPIERSWNPYAFFVDIHSDNDETEDSKYNYHGQFHDAGIYIMSGEFWEHEEYYLVEKKAGIKTAIWGSPYISPSQKYIANLSPTFGLDGLPNGFQVWKLEQREQYEMPTDIRKYIELHQEIWVPEDIVWESDNSLIIMAIDIDNYFKQNQKVDTNRSFYLRLKF